jgi:hypothetical protein
LKTGFYGFRCGIFCWLTENKDQSGRNPAHFTAIRDWNRFSEMLHDTLELVLETARERGIDLDAIERDAGGRSDDVDERSPAVHLIAHASKHYAVSVDSWVDSNEGLFLESIRRRVEVQFPHARAFVRPGFDEV